MKIRDQYNFLQGHINKQKQGKIQQNQESGSESKQNSTLSVEYSRQILNSLLIANPPAFKGGKSGKNPDGVVVTDNFASDGRVIVPRKFHPEATSLYNALAIVKKCKSNMPDLQTQQELPQDSKVTSLYVVHKGDFTNEAERIVEENTTLKAKARAFVQAAERCHQEAMAPDTPKSSYTLLIRSLCFQKLSALCVEELIREERKAGTLTASSEASKNLDLGLVYHGIAHTAFIIKNKFGDNEAEAEPDSEGEGGDDSLEALGYFTGESDLFGYAAMDRTLKGLKLLYSKKNHPDDVNQKLTNFRISLELDPTEPFLIYACREVHQGTPDSTYYANLFNQVEMAEIGEFEKLLKHCEKNDLAKLPDAAKLVRLRLVKTFGYFAHNRMSDDRLRVKIRNKIRLIKNFLSSPTQKGLIERLNLKELNDGKEFPDIQDIKLRELPGYEKEYNDVMSIPFILKTGDIGAGEDESYDPYDDGPPDDISS